MTKKVTNSGRVADLRKQAEKFTKGKVALPLENIEKMSPAKIKRTLHELRVHQIELELQNEELQQAQAELEASRLRYVDLYDLAPVGYVTVSEKGLILEANLTASTMLGVPRGKMMKRIFSRYILREDEGIYYLNLKQLFSTGKPKVYELRMEREDGSIFWVRLATIAAMDTNGTMACRIIISNISDNKLQEDALKERIKELNCLYGMSYLFELQDLSSDELFRRIALLIPPAWQYPDITSASISVKGKIYPAPRFRKTSWMQSCDVIVNGQPIGQVQVCYLEERQTSDEGPFLKEERHLLKTIAENISRAIERREDITALEKTRKELEAMKIADDAAREYAESLINTVREPLIVLDQDLRVVTASRSFYEFFKVIPEDTEGQLIYDLGNKQWDIPKLRELLETILPEKATFDNYEVEHDFATIGKRIMLLNARQIQRVSGKEKIILLAIEDITERRQLEATKEILDAKNLQLQKTESLSRMAASIAHLFNNKLGVVIGNLELAMLEVSKEGSLHESLNAATKAAWESANISGMMLTFLGQSYDKVEPLDISNSCRKFLPTINAAMPENVTLETNFPSPGPVINTNSDYMQQLLTNLLTNAWEAVGKKSGTVSLCVKTVSSEQIHAAYLRPVNWQPQNSTYACLEVTDNGCGIEDKNIEKLFDPFYTSKFTGRGMGLAVVLGIVKTHKGVLTVESKVKQGSTFRIFLPLAEEALPQTQKAGSKDDAVISAASPRKFEEGETVLLIEDEEELRNMVAAMLKRLGFEVLEAKDGVQAVEVFWQNREKISCVLTDLTMPRMDGWETLNALRKLQPGIPVILASGYDKAHVMEGDHPEMPQAFLAKPYNLEGLSGAIREVMGMAKGKAL